MQVIVTQFDGVSTIRALPLAAGLLVASARAATGVRTRTELAIRTARLDPDALADDLGGCDVLACSTYVWNERYSLEIARRARARRPDALVLFGGPSVPRRPERAARYLREHPWIDALAFGEGELVFRDVLLALLDGRPLAAVPGLALRARAHPEGTLLTAPRARLAGADFEETASPYLDGSFDALVAEGAAPEGAIIETNRGCPFACTFCDWGQAVASRVHELPLARLEAELAWIARRAIPYVYIVDANYGMRRRDLAIVREIGRLRAARGFPRYVFFHLTKNATERHLEVVLALHQAGIGTHLALSAQDFEPRVLRAVRRANIRLDRALELRRICHERGIPTFNELILGLPEQSYESFARSLVRALTPYPLDSFNLYLARMLENAEMAAPEQRVRYGIETRQVRIASFHHGGPATHVPEREEVVVATRAMPEADWRRAFKLGFFLAAACNLRLLDLPLQVAWRAAGVDVLGMLEGLLAHMARAGHDTALGRIEAALERYANAVLSGDTMVLPDARTGDHLWAVEDAVALEALAGHASFFSEIASVVRATADGRGAHLLEQAVRFQGTVTPAFGDRAARRFTGDYDFAAWRALPAATNGPPVPHRRAAVAWTPAAALSAAGDLRTFLVRYLAAVHARAETGTLTAAGAGLTSRDSP